MRYSFVVRFPTIVALAAFATLGAVATAPAAFAAVARVTCSKVVGVGNASHPAVISGCNDVAKTGGKGTLVATYPNRGPDGFWTFTWAGSHGTTTVHFRSRTPKKSFCPKGWIAFVDTGHVIGGTGPAATVMPRGQTVSARGCGNPKTNTARLAKGSKFIL
jgi:hypothetical protein